MRLGGWEWDPKFFLHINFNWVKISLHVKFHPPGLPISVELGLGQSCKKTKNVQDFAVFRGLEGS